MSAQALAPYEPGQLIPGYSLRVTKALGAGGMGFVYLVQDEDLDVPRVCKMLHVHYRDREDLARRMKKEAQALARLRHPNVVQVLHAGITKDALGLPFFVMEWLHGYDLRTVLNAKRRQGKRIGVSKSLEIGIELLDALEAAHELGIIHRDVKPENVFLAQDGAAIKTKLLDFGVLAVFDGRKRTTGPAFVGTLRYGAPEQIEHGRVSAQTDLYSAALVIYEMLAGRGPFDDDGGRPLGDVQIAACHVNPAVNPQPPSHWAPEVPEPLASAVLWGLEKDSTQRAPTAFTFGLKLRRLREELFGTQVVLGGAGKTDEEPFSAEQLSAHALPDSQRTTRAERAAAADVTQPGMPAMPVENATLEEAPKELLAEILGLATTSPGDTASAVSSERTVQSVDRAVTTRSLDPTPTVTRRKADTEELPPPTQPSVEAEVPRRKSNPARVFDAPSDNIFIDIDHYRNYSPVPISSELSPDHAPTGDIFPLRRSARARRRALTLAGTAAAISVAVFVAFAWGVRRTPVRLSTARAPVVAPRAPSATSSIPTVPLAASVEDVSLDSERDGGALSVRPQASPASQVPAAVRPMAGPRSTVPLTGGSVVPPAPPRSAPIPSGSSLPGKTDVKRTVGSGF